MAKYSSLPNNRAGCDKCADWENILNLDDFKNQKCLKPV